MRKEKFIVEEHNKKSVTFRVVIKVNGRSKCFGSFNTKNYLTPKMALEAAKLCRDEALTMITQKRVIEHHLTVQEAYNLHKELITTNVKTQERHDAAYYALIPEEMRHRPLESITAADIQKTMNEYSATHSQGQTNKAMTVWRQIYQACLLKEIPIIDRTRMVMKPKSKVPTRHIQKHCSEEDLEKFIEALCNYGNDRVLTDNIAYILRIMQHLGLRPQEAFAVCREDIDLENELFYVQHSIGSDSESGRKLITMKTPWSIRTLPIPTKLKPILQRLLETRFTEPLLLAPDGQPFEISWLDTMMENVSQKCGTKVNLYMMRHNFATRMVQKEIKATQNMMGHKTANMTLQYVQDTSVERMKEMLDPKPLS